MQEYLKKSSCFFALIFLLFVIAVSLPGIFETGEFLKTHFDSEYRAARTDRNAVYLPPEKVVPPPPGKELPTRTALKIPAKPEIPRAAGNGNGKKKDAFSFLPEHPWKTKLQKVLRQVTDLQSSLEFTVITDFPLRYEFSEYNMAFKHFLGMKSPVDGETLLLLPDGMISDLSKESDCKAACYYAELAKELHASCLVVIDPRKNDFYSAEHYYGLDGKRERSLQKNIETLKKHNIAVLDLREVFFRQNMTVSDIFYRGDHHWKTPAALLAAEAAAAYMNQHCGTDYDLQLLKKESFLHEIHRENFIGSSAKKTGVAYSGNAEDFTVFVPPYKTHFTMTVMENDRISRQFSGDFRAIHNYRELYRDPYRSNPYALYTFGNKPFIRIVNHLIRKTPKIAVLKNSFANAVIPYLALQTSEIVVYDERHMTMEKITESLIREQPDIILYLNSLFDICYGENPDHFKH